jgi:hypothetical protein
LFSPRGLDNVKLTEISKQQQTRIAVSTARELSDNCSVFVDVDVDADADADADADGNVG